MWNAQFSEPSINSFSAKTERSAISLKYWVPFPGQFNQQICLNSLWPSAYDILNYHIVQSKQKVITFFVKIGLKRPETSTMVCVPSTSDQLCFRRRLDPYRRFLNRMKKITIEPISHIYLGSKFHDVWFDRKLINIEKPRSRIGAAPCIALMLVNV